MAETKQETKKDYDLVAKAKLFITIPAVIFAAALLVLLFFGAQVSIEFKGGTFLTYSYKGTLDIAAVQSAVEAQNLGKVSVTTGSALGAGEELKTITVTFSNQNNEGLTGDQQGIITEALQKDFPDNQLAIANSQNVSPSTGKAFFAKCLVAVLFSFILLILYIAFRFRKIGGWAAGVFALVSLLVDVFMVICTFIFCRLAIDANFMAVVLTILGYSINNTIVIYDRVRENKRLFGDKLTNRELVNKSIRQSLTRSFYTTLTTGAAVLVIIIVALATGVTSIISFALPMFVGLLSGLYSSLCLSGPLWVLWQEREHKTA
jgi:preprotein translocase subunit SecF